MYEKKQEAYRVSTQRVKSGGSLLS